jgi:hypothetical protein
LVLGGLDNIADKIVALKADTEHPCRFAHQCIAIKRLDINLLGQSEQRLVGLQLAVVVSALAGQDDQALWVGYGKPVGNDLRKALALGR